MYNTNANSPITGILFKGLQKYGFGTGILRIFVRQHGSFVFGKWQDYSRYPTVMRSIFKLQGYLRERQSQGDIGTTIFIEC